MAVCTEFVGGYLLQTGSSVESCTGYVLVSANEYASYFEAFTLNSEQITTSIIFGFSVVVTSYFLSYPVGIAKGLIKKT